MKIRGLGWGRHWDTHVNKHVLGNCIAKKKNLLLLCVCVCVSMCNVCAGMHAQPEKRALNP